MTFDRAYISSPSNISIDQMWSCTLGCSPFSHDKHAFTLDRRYIRDAMGIGSEPNKQPKFSPGKESSKLVKGMWRKGNPGNCRSM